VNISGALAAPNLRSYYRGPREPAIRSCDLPAADAPYTPAVLNLIAQLEPSNPPTEAELANASLLFHGGI
jgi:hypothetical protein